jgi:hypothetical protein
MISENALYLKYIYHENRVYAVKEDFLFGVFFKYPFLSDVLGIYILFSYSAIIITTIILIIRDFIAIKHKGNQDSQKCSIKSNLL